MLHTIQKYSAGGVVYSDQKVLMIKILPENEVIFPKGTIEVGETPEQTAIREVFEETGYKAKIKGSLGTEYYEYDEDGKHFGKTVHHFLMELIDKNLEPTPHREAGENFENLWLPINETFKALTFQASRDTLEKAIKIIDQNTHKYVVAHLLRPIEDSSEYQTNNSPLHVTLLQIFSLPKKDVKKLVDKLNTVTNNLRPFSVFAEGSAMFGPNKDVPVITVKRTPQILDLHLKLIESIKTLNPGYIFPGFMKDNFSPHCTIEPNQQIKPGDKINIDSFSLLDCGENDDGLIRVIKTFKL
jgi:8-oxo-dGTP pyrophosphatase MutT (NUDIX family)/2'-5' RNA ligase